MSTKSNRCHLGMLGGLNWPLWHNCVSIRKGDGGNVDEQTVVGWW